MILPRMIARGGIVNPDRGNPPILPTAGARTGNLRVPYSPPGWGMPAPQRRRQYPTRTPLRVGVLAFSPVTCLGLLRSRLRRSAGRYPSFPAARLGFAVRAEPPPDGGHHGTAVTTGEAAI